MSRLLQMHDNRVRQEEEERRQQRRNEGGIIRRAAEAIDSSLDGFRTSGQVRQEDGTPMPSDEGASTFDRVSAFSDATADGIGGGIGRGVLRAADYLIPGTSLTDFADEWDDRARASIESQKAQGAARVGDITGTIFKGIFDVASLVAPSMLASRALRGTEWFRRGTESGSRMTRLSTRAAENVASGVPASAVDVAQEVGRGNDPNVVRSALVGAGVDAAVPLAGAAFRFARRLRNSGVDDVVSETLAREATAPPPTPAATTTEAFNLDAAVSRNAAKAAVENPEAIGRAFRETGVTDSRNLVLNALAREENKGGVRSMLRVLLGDDAPSNSLNRLTREITEADNFNDVLRHIEAEHARINTGAAPSSQAMRALDGDAPAPRTEAVSEAATEQTGRTVAAEVGTDTPTIATSVSRDLQSRIDDGAIIPGTSTRKLSQLQMGSDSIPESAADPLDLNRVAEYRAMIEAGEPIDPIVINRTANGAEYVSDGQHRLAAMQELGVEDVPVIQERQSAHALAARVETPTAAEIEQPINMRVLGDTAEEVQQSNPNFRPTDKTYFEEGTNIISEDISRMAQELGVELNALDPNVMRELTRKGIQYGSKEQAYNAIAQIAQDTITFAGRTLGKPGTDLVYGLIQGEKFMKDHIMNLRSLMTDTQDLITKAVGGKRGRRSSVAREKVFENVVRALEDRANINNYLRNDTEVEIYRRFESFFDYFKELRLMQNLPVEENYRPWVRMSVATEPPRFSVTGNKINLESPFSKERFSDIPLGEVEGDMGMLMYRYAMSQLSEMAYRAPIEQFNRAFGEAPSWVRARNQDMQTGLQYISDLLNNTIRPKRKNIVERGIDKAVSNVYGNILRFNARVALLNLPQRWLSNTQVSKQAVRESKKVPKHIQDQMMPGMAFGNKTVNDMVRNYDPPTGRNTRSKDVADALDRIDFEAKSEIGNIINGYRKGFVQGISETDPFKAARQQGSSFQEAMEFAMRDEQAWAAAARQGNLVVNNTQFGISKIAKPLMLRAGGSWARPFQMFIRFPLGMSNYTLQSMNSRNMRALEFLKSGDPRKGSLADMHMSFRTLEDAIEESLSAARQGVDVNVPADVLEQQLRFVRENAGIVDREIKKLSNLSGKRNIMTIARMWAAAAAIQVVFDGGMSTIFDEPEETIGQAITRSNPTVADRVVGRNSPFAGITSAASPITPYGNVNTRALLNYIPGVGAVANRGRDVINIIESLTGESLTGD